MTVISRYLILLMLLKGIISWKSYFWMVKI